LYFRDRTDNEIGGFGISPLNDLLYIEEFVTVKQEVSAISIKFDDNSVADLFDQQVDLGRKPEQFARIWIHSHPSDCPEPSLTDEETFKRVFGACQWAVMFILAKDNSIYTNLRFNVGPGGQSLIHTEIDYSEEFGSSNKNMWDAEYKENIQTKPLKRNTESLSEDSTASWLDEFAFPQEFIEEFEEMEPDEKQAIIDELAERSGLCDTESEVMHI
jgi:hypothetical protein